VSGDFFSTSGCRDLLFHAREHVHRVKVAVKRALLAAWERK
jgi:hypothetical protein